MDKLVTITDLQASKGEVCRNLLTLPIADLQVLARCLFEEAREKSLTHPNDVLVSRRGSALRPVSFALAEDIWFLAHSLTNSKTVPRSLIKNGKRGAVALESWRTSDKCHALVDELSSAGAQTIGYSLPEESLPCNDISRDLSYLSEPSTLLSNSLPSVEVFASSMIMKEMNYLRTEVQKYPISAKVFGEVL